MKEFRKILLLLDKKAYKILFALFVLQLGLNAFQIVEVIIMRNLIIAINSKPLLITTIIIFLCIIIVKNIENCSISILCKSLQNQISNALYKKIGNSIEKIDILEFNRADFFVNLNRIKTTVNHTITQDIISLFIILSSVIGIIGISSYVGYKNPVYIIFLLVINIIQNINKHHYSKERIKFVRSIDKEIRKQNYFDNLIINRSYVKEIRCYQLYNWVKEKRYISFNVTKKKHVSFSKRWTVINVLTNCILFTLETLLVILMFNDMRLGKLILADIIALIQAYQMFISSMTGVIENIFKIQSDKVYFKEFIEFLDTESRNREYISVNHEQNILEINNLSFEYFKGQKVLNNISLNLKKGETIALIGENGSGKSTLTNIILKLIMSYEGQIRVDNKSSIGAIFQDFSKFKLTIGENIAIGSINQLSKKEKILKIVEEINAGFITNLPNDIDTEIGKEFNANGIELSGGQWQKIGIARVIFCNADLVIFDEPTAALDPIEEREQFLTLIEHIRSKTAIIITHRVGIAKYVDRIICIEKGKIIEQGTHDKLLAADGYYAKLYNNQSKWYGLVSIT